jgi:hypothetical protein
MKIPRVYIDTSVFGGAFDEEFKVPSNMFFDEVRAGKFKPVISLAVEGELELAPVEVKELFVEISSLAERVELSSEATALQEAYIQSGIVSVKSELDAMHVALATVSSCFMIVSWNFKHIVHYQKVPLYNGVSRARGYVNIGIHSPLEIIEVINNDES